MSPNTLPGFDFPFDFDAIGEQTKKRFLGSFVYTKPNIRNISNIAKHKAKLDGGLTNIDSNTSFLHSMLAYLRFCLTDYPKWWEECGFGEELYDIDIIGKLYEQCTNFEDEFGKNLEKDNKVTKEKKEAKENKDGGSL